MIRMAHNATGRLPLAVNGYCVIGSIGMTVQTPMKTLKGPNRPDPYRAVGAP